jgi:hypothetical protein
MTFLPAADVERLTGKKRWSAQCRALAEAGIRFRRAGANKDGEPLVLVSDLDAKGKPAQRGHRWDMIASVRNLHAQTAPPARPRRA